LCLQHDQVADAGLIGPPAVLDDQYVAVSGAAQRLQEHIDAPVVAGRQRTAGDLRPGDDCADAIVAVAADGSVHHRWNFIDQDGASEWSGWHQMPTPALGKRAVDAEAPGSTQQNAQQGHTDQDDLQPERATFPEASERRIFDLAAALG
jgi:hypothetical protein